MSEVTFGRLEDLPLREAWKHESLGFTPWLAENIDYIADAIGISLEITGQEVAVESFSADILARNPQDDSLVLIENQLEATDHTHLGQIMTYLAGLEAQIVIWIAPSFREPHLSAIRWLNEHTDGFSFFAVRVRVVRIGNSPFAPVFEVVEKPNDWDREIRQQTASEGAAYYDIKHAFWKQLLAANPDLAKLGFKPCRYPNNYIAVHEEPRIDLAIWLGKTESGIYVRSGWGKPAEPVAELLEPHRAQLEHSLETALGPSGRGDRFLAKTFPKGHAHEDDWPEIMDWMKNNVAAYRAALQPVLRGDA